MIENIFAFIGMCAFIILMPGGSIIILGGMAKSLYDHGPVKFFGPGSNENRIMRIGLYIAGVGIILAIVALVGLHFLN